MESDLLALTGALGLMTTLGFMLFPYLLGLLESGGGGPASGCCMNWFCCEESLDDVGATAAVAALRSEPSWLLFLVSARFWVDEVGVACAEPDGECEPETA